MANAYNVPHAGETIHASDITNALSSYVTATTLDSIIDLLTTSIGKNLEPVNWTIVDNFAFGELNLRDEVNSICYGNGRFVAGSSFGNIAYSDDGITWSTLPEAGFESTCVYSICYGNGRFVVGGSDGVIGYSTDGLSWTTAISHSMGNSPFAFNEVRAVCYGNGRFVAGGYNGQMAYSMNGINWTAAGPIPHTSRINSICYGNGKFVAVGEGRKIAYSTDGITWTEVDEEGLFGADSGLLSVCYGNGRFVVGGDTGRIVYSTDGINWTVLEGYSFHDGYPVNSICYGWGKFIACGLSGKMAYSLDGITWASVNKTVFGSAHITSSYYGNGRYVIGSGDGRIAYSYTVGEIGDSYFVPKDCKAGDTVILDGIECLCVATGVNIQGSNLTRIAVDKNYDLGYYQKYAGMTQDGVKISQIRYWRWGGTGTQIGDTSQDVGYGLKNTLICLANSVNYTSGTSTSSTEVPLMWKGVNDFRSSHSDKWFVPSLNELKNYVHPYRSSLKFDNTTGGSSSSAYWSSSEYTKDRSYNVNAEGAQGNDNKSYGWIAVRLCRAF